MLIRTHGMMSHAFGNDMRLLRAGSAQSRDFQISDCAVAQCTRRADALIDTCASTVSHSCMLAYLLRFEVLFFSDPLNIFRTCLRRACLVGSGRSHSSCALPMMSNGD